MSDAPVMVFLQDARIGRVQFMLRGKELTITPRTRGGLTDEIRLSVDDLDPDYQIKWQSLGLMWKLPLGLAFFCALISKYLLAMDLPWGLLGVYPLLFVMQFLVLSVRGLPPIEWIVFNRVDGTGTVRIVREKRQTEDCSEFIAALVERIKTNGVLVDLSAPELRSTVAYSGAQKEKRPYGDNWLLAILAGIAAAALPFLSRSNGGDEGAIFMLFFMTVLGALSLALVSFLRGEKRKWWSMIGVAVVLATLLVDFDVL